jgi:hypothetical protein
MIKTSLKTLRNKSKYAIILIAVQAIFTPASVLFSTKSAAQITTQLSRSFPETAVRGKIAFKAPPLIELDGRADRLSPGARIHDEQHMLAMTGALAGKQFVVNYKREPSTGMVQEVWLLTADEAKVKREVVKK